MLTTTLGRITGTTEYTGFTDRHQASEVAMGMIENGLENVHVEVDLPVRWVYYYHACAYTYDQENRDERTIHLDLTLEELEGMVCEGRMPIWIEHRYLCHPERECEDGCDMGAIPLHLHRYQQS